ncbi:unnamed protein product [Durusdinium trenchii]|uniref:SET domain-containing protein 5 n=2 Tax=Durusdinium trenchii TaxID=1381693 RepID=A0ABP0S5F9_9DINO
MRLHCFIQSSQSSHSGLPLQVLGAPKIGKPCRLQRSWGHLQVLSCATAARELQCRVVRRRSDVSKVSKAKARNYRRQNDVVDSIDYKSNKISVHAVGKKGLGVIATSSIKCGDLLLEEAPLLIFQKQSFDVLFGDLQDVLVDDTSFDHWEESLTETLQSKCDEEVRAQFWDLADTCCAKDKTALGIARTNAIGLSDESAGLFLLLSRFNHSCKPNVHNSWQEDRGVQVLKATRDISEGEELCISYLSFLNLCAPTRERLGELSDRFGFDCLCEACSRVQSESDWRRERLSQLCEAFSRDEASQMRGPNEAKRDGLEDFVESMNMRDGLRETTDLIEQEFAGNPAALSLIFFGAFRRAAGVGRKSAAKSLAKAAWKATVASEGSSWRAELLKTLASDGKP